MGLGREPKFLLWRMCGFNTADPGLVMDSVGDWVSASMGAMTTVSSGSDTWPLTLGVKLCRRPMGGLYDEEALIGSGLLLHISSMFGGGTGEEY